MERNTGSLSIIMELQKISLFYGNTDTNPNLEEIKKEHTVLKEAQSSNISFNNKINDLYKSLKEINLKLWNIEDKLRIYEKEKNFSKNFIDLARDVYITNDKRSMVKSEINKELGSNIKEIKQYVKY